LNLALDILETRGLRFVSVLFTTFDKGTFLETESNPPFIEVGESMFEVRASAND